MLLVEKYKPRDSKEIIGQERAVHELREALRNKESCLVYGGVGNGKTSGVYAAASELGYEIFELNSSDSRGKEAVNLLLSGAVEQASLFSRGKIILVDDVDALSGNDRGGLQEIMNFMNKSHVSFVFTCYDVDNDKFKQLKKECRLIEFGKVDSSKIFNHLKDICEKENIEFNESMLKEISRKCDGDIRNAVNELEMAFVENENNDFSYKDARGVVDETLNLIFKSKNFEAIEKSFDSLDWNFDEIMLWVDENIPYEYDVKSLEDAYSALSLADIFKARIRRRQYYRYMVYQKSFMSYGVAVAKSEKRSGIIKYKRPGRLLKIWIMNRKNMAKKELAGEIAEKIHVSKKRAFKELEFMKFKPFLL